MAAGRVATLSAGRKNVLHLLLVSAAAQHIGSAVAAQDAPSLLGTWRGSYLCLQGKTGLTLTIDKQAGSALSGYFHFYPPLWNPLAKEGCFSVRGEVDGANHVKLDPVRWITRPDGYVTVGLDGNFSPARPTITGLVIAPPPIENGCQGFEVDRINSEADLLGPCQGPELLARGPN